MQVPAVLRRNHGAGEAGFKSVATALMIVTVAAGPFCESRADEGKLDIVATAATATIAASGSGRRPVALPGLTYSFQLLHECAASLEPASLSLTIADSHRSIGAGELVAADGVAKLDMEIPASQLPPVILSDFCAANHSQTDAEGPQLKTLTALLSAAASLKCANEESDERTIYSMTPLDVVLVCERDAAPAGIETGN